MGRLAPETPPPMAFEPLKIVCLGLFRGFHPVQGLNKLGEGVSLRRLFSTFARGLPGAGLLLMRVVAGATLVAHGVGEFRAGLPLEATMLNVLAIADGAFLTAGLWTPIAGSLVVILALSISLVDHENPSFCILLGTIGAALALLGPGAWSLDAWLFGWKRIDIED
jgi:putative oxidoreductase